MTGSRGTLDEADALRRIAEGVEAETGEEFFRSLVRAMSESLGVAYAFVSELVVERKSFRTLAVWGHGQPLENFELPLAGTPCEQVLRGEPAHHAEHLQDRFPDDIGLRLWGVHSYCGVPLLDGEDSVLGHLAIFDTAAMEDPRGLAILRIFASRARVELQRGREEAALRGRESRYRDLYEEAPIAYVTVGAAGEIESVNRRAVELFGYESPGEIVGRRPGDFCPDTPGGKPVAARMLEAFRAGRSIDDVELECERKDGARLFVLVSFRVLRDESGRIAAARTALIDVTARKSAEAHLRHSEERFRDLYEAAPVAYITIGGDGAVQALNAEAAKQLGLARDAAVGRPFLDFVPASARPHAAELIERAIAGEDVTDAESASLRPDGSSRPILVSIRGIRGTSGTVERFRVTFVDIAARKRLEDDLRASDAMHRDLYHEAPVAYITIGVDARIQNLNEQTIKIFGYTREQSIGRDFLDFIPEHARPGAGGLFLRAMQGEPIDDEETEATRADGSSVFLRVSARPIRGVSGDIDAFRVTFVDVSARKRVERQLQDSENRYRDLYQEAPIAYWYVTRDGTIAEANRAMAETFGTPREELIGRSLFTLYADTPHGKAKAATVRDRARAGEEVRREELECVHADGSTFWIRVSVKPQRDEHGEVGGWRVNAIDVTAQKRAEQVVRVTEYLQEEIRAVHNVEEMIGRSPALLSVLEKVRLVAETDSSVLILGETGTGKEIFARAVHSASRRRNRPLIKVNCAALPSGLVESELFGHEKGAFTGASERRIGRFELADGGTIFLDEIGEVSPDVQVKLLRVLQEKEIERVGGNKTIRVDVRVIAATNRDLKAAAGAGKFRQDLYYRLNVFPLELPPLRERLEDVPLLVHYFVTRFAARIGRRIDRVPDAVMARILAYPWPGNVRELEHVIERAVILSSGPELDAVPDLSSSVPATPLLAERVPPMAENLRGTALHEIERQHIVATLKRAGWRVEGTSGAAAQLGMNPSTLRSRMKKLGIARSRDEHLAAS